MSIKTQWELGTRTGVNIDFFFLVVILQPTKQTLGCCTITQTTKINIFSITLLALFETTLLKTLHYAPKMYIFHT